MKSSLRGGAITSRGQKGEAWGLGKGLKSGYQNSSTDSLELKIQKQMHIPKENFEEILNSMSKKSVQLLTPEKSQESDEKEQYLAPGLAHQQKEAKLDFAFTEITSQRTQANEKREDQKDKLIAKLTKETDCLRADLREARLTIDELIQKERGYISKLRVSELDKEALQAQLQQSRIAFNQAVKDREENAKEKESKHLEQIAELKATISDYVKVIRELEAELDSQVEYIKKLDGEVQSLQNERDDYQMMLEGCLDEAEYRAGDLINIERDSYDQCTIDLGKLNKSQNQLGEVFELRVMRKSLAKIKNWPRIQKEELGQRPAQTSKPIL